MPRPSKAVRRQKVNAGIEYKKGNRKEAYAIWAKAADARRELQAKKKKHPSAAPEAAPSEGGESPD